MAKLVLTAKERKANTWLALDDASLGRLVKKLALGIKDHKHHPDRVWTISAAMLLCSSANDVNAETAVTTLSGLTENGKPCGDWKVTVKRLTKPAPDSQAIPRGEGQMNGPMKCIHGQWFTEPCKYCDELNRAQEEAKAWFDERYEDMKFRREAERDTNSPQAS